MHRKQRDICNKLRQEATSVQKERQEEDEVLTLKHLKLTFLYWAGGVGLATAAFVLELSLKRPMRGCMKKY